MRLLDRQVRVLGSQMRRNCARRRTFIISGASRKARRERAYVRRAGYRGGRYEARVDTTAQQYSDRYVRNQLRLNRLGKQMVQLVQPIAIAAPGFLIFRQLPVALDFHCAALQVERERVRGGQFGESLQHAQIARDETECE